jgi:hypothetical protein
MVHTNTLFIGSHHHLRPAILLALKINSIEEDGSSCQNSLLRNTRFGRKVDLKGVRLGKDSRSCTLGFLENLANMRSISIRISLIRRKDPKGNLAASSSTTRVAFGARIHAAPTTARGRVDLVDFRAIWIHDLVHGDTKVASFLDGTKFLSTARNHGRLVAATLARSSSTGARTLDSKELGVGVEFLHLCSVRVAGVAAVTAAPVGLFERIGNLVTAYKVLELVLGLASTAELGEPATARLADLHGRCGSKVRLESICSTFHRLGFGRSDSHALFRTAKMGMRKGVRWLQFQPKHVISSVLSFRIDSFFYYYTAQTHL